MKGLYVHIPFCRRKCLYCDFFSICDTSRLGGYLAALDSEMARHRGEVCDSVFIGGGTPTAIGEGLFEVVKSINENFTRTTDCEFSVEANPGTVDSDMLKELRSLGVNRISFGAQSFVDDELRALGRIHSASEIEKSVTAAHDAGFDNISLDLMLGIPHQTIESAKYSTDAALSLGVSHISAYSLIVEENTPFYDMELDLPDEETERKIYWQTVDILEKAGLFQYEISNFAKDGYASRHNIKYWTMKEYIGVGAGAHSMYDNVRWYNNPSIDDYIAGYNTHLVEEQIDGDTFEKERFMLGLRMTRGMEYNGEFPDKIKKLVLAGLIEGDSKSIRLTKKGIDLANIAFGEFV